MALPHATVTDDVFREDIEFQRLDNRKSKAEQLQSVSAAVWWQSACTLAKSQPARHWQAQRRHREGTCCKQLLWWHVRTTLCNELRQFSDLLTKKPKGLWMFRVGGSSGAKWLPRDARSDLVPSRS